MAGRAGCGTGAGAPEVLTNGNGDDASGNAFDPLDRRISDGARDTLKEMDAFQDAENQFCALDGQFLVKRASGPCVVPELQAGRLAGARATVMSGSVAQIVGRTQL